jgi:biotin carboxyl carrier protein
MATRSKKRMPNSKRSAPFKLRFRKFGGPTYINIKERTALYSHRANAFIQKRPFSAFFISLALLFLIILLGSTVFKAKTPAPKSVVTTKNIVVYRLGQAPKITVQAEVTKNGVINIVAQTPGIVSSINVNEGNNVAKGKTLINLSSNYQGGNVFSLQRQLAGLQYQNTKDTYDSQKDLIQRQRDLANAQSSNADELRKITGDSIDETQSLVDLNSDILTTIKTNIQTLQDNNGDAQQILSLKQLQAQLQAGTNQLQAGLRTSRYQTDTGAAPAQIQQITKDITLKQLDLQEKALKLGLETSGIQLHLAQVQESTMFPASPFAGTVQKVHVKVGESVNPGTVLVTLAGDAGCIVLDAKVPKEIAEKVSRIEESVIDINGKHIPIVPSYISTEATSGQLYSVLFTLDSSYNDLFTDSAFVSVTLPIGIQRSGSVIPFIPVDSVFQTQNEAYVFVVEGNKARSKKVTLGTVTGSYVTVTNGLGAKDTIILDRTVVDGDVIHVTN